MAGVLQPDQITEYSLAAFREGRWEDAIQELGQALQSRTEASGSVAEECADLYYHYGAALFYRAQEESDVFGAPVDSAVAARQDPESDVGPSNPTTTVSHAEPSSSGREDQATENQDGEEDAENEGEEDADDDMQLAWENLEVAKTLYERNKEQSFSRLVEIHALLADIAMEQENFETALSDYTTAFQMVKEGSTSEKGLDRRLAELHFKIGLVLQFLQKPEDALKEVEAAIAICTKCLESDEKVLSEEPAAALQSVLEDLKAKEEELKQAIQEIQKQKDTVKAAFQKAMGSANGRLGGQGTQASQTKVVDLGTVGQGRRRINLAPVQAKSDVAKMEPVATNQKRSLEDLMGQNATSGTSADTLALTTDTNKRQHTDTSKNEQPKPVGKENIAQESLGTAMHGEIRPNAEAL